MNRSRLALVALLVACGVGALESPAQDAKKEKKDASKQKAAAAENIKKAELGKSIVVESEHFLVATTLSEDKAKVLGTFLDKIVPVARKALQFEEKDEAWKGKLAVYFLPDSRDFKSFIRSVVGMQPSGVHYDVRADDPFVVDPVDVPGKATEGDQFVNCGAVAAGAFLKSKGSTATLPEWLVGGFGRATALRAEGVNSQRFQRYKAAARGVSRGGKPTELWAETKPANADTLATSFADYLSYGPGAPNFVKLVYGFRPDDAGNAPSPQAAFEAAGWKDLMMLENAWRKWATTGK